MNKHKEVVEVAKRLLADIEEIKVIGHWNWAEQLDKTDVQSLCLHIIEQSKQEEQD